MREMFERTVRTAVTMRLVDCFRSTRVQPAFPPLDMRLLVGMAALLGVLAVSLLVPAGPVRAEGSGDEPHPPQAVTGRVSITNSVSHSSVELTWSEPASGSAAQYRIVRQSVHFYGMVFQVGEPVTVTGRSYTDTDVIPSGCTDTQ